MCIKHKNHNQYMVVDSQSDQMLLYQEVLADIRYWKTQQWLITTYVAGIYAGLITLANIVFNKNSHYFFFVHGKFFLPIIDIIILLVIIFGCFFLFQYAKNTWDGRDVKEKIIANNQMLKFYLGEKIKDRSDIIIFLIVFMIFTIAGGILTAFAFRIMT